MSNIKSTISDSNSSKSHGWYKDSSSHNDGQGDEYFSPSKKDFMINYQVQNIEGLVNKLQENGVTILDSIATYDFGKFVHIL